MKRAVTFFITLVLAVCSIPFSANAQVVNDFIPNSNIEYTLDTKQGTLEIKGAGEIPDSFNSPFVHISDYIKNVTISSGITSIGKRLFKNCTAVEKINFADTIIDKEYYSNSESRSNPDKYGRQFTGAIYQKVR